VNEFTIRLVLSGSKAIEFHGPADITKEATEAIVNAANSSLLGGGGVDGAIHRAGGPSILKECQRIVAEIGRLPAGRAVITTGGRLPARYVIHTVGPIYGRGDRDEAVTLADCYRESIRLADDHGVGSLAFPAISTGAYGYPVHEAATVSIRSTVESLGATTHLRLVRFVLFDVNTLKAYCRAAENLARSNSTSSIKLEKAP
jgi:O-acetyl-ADP-ribose deacetylase (regulator of RNase III)